MNIPEGKERDIVDSDYPDQDALVWKWIHPWSSANDLDELMSDDYKDHNVEGWNSWGKWLNDFDSKWKSLESEDYF